MTPFVLLISCIIVAFAKFSDHHPARPIESGYIIKSECSDFMCETDCRIVEHHQVFFDICYRNSMYHCQPGNGVLNPHTSQNVIMEFWDNSQCHGYPRSQYRSDFCYTERREDNENRSCCNGDGYSFYKYECQVYNTHVHDELRMSQDDNERNNNINISILILILVIVCLAGIFAGYLLYTRRKKRSAENEFIHLIA